MIAWPPELLPLCICPSSRRLERRRPEERYADEQPIKLTPLLVLLLLANELYQPFAMAAQPY